MPSGVSRLPPITSSIPSGSVTTALITSMSLDVIELMFVCNDRIFGDAEELAPPVGFPDPPPPPAPVPPPPIPDPHAVTTSATTSAPRSARGRGGGHSVWVGDGRRWHRRGWWRRVWESNRWCELFRIAENSVVAHEHQLDDVE